MNKFLFPVILFSNLIVCSCSVRNDKIAGYWEATFHDSVQNPRQYLNFEIERNSLLLRMDEPTEDWYDIPGEKVYFKKDSLYFERFWGLEKYYGKFSVADSVFYGFKQISNKPPVPFTMQKTQPDKLTFKIPRLNREGQPVSRYQYRKPVQLNDNFICSDLAGAGIDSALIIQLINKILLREIPNIHSILMMKDNKLVLEEYFYDYSPNRLHRVHSVTKSFTSALLGIAIDRKLISGTNEPVWKFFQYRNSTKWINEKYDVQIGHLLSMSAGLDWKGLTLGESNDDMDMYKTDDCFGYLLNKELKYKPGTNFCYNNGLSLMLGHIIEKSSGLPVDSFARENLFKQLEINDYSWEINDNGIIRTDGGLKLRPRDMLKFGQMYLNDGKWNHTQVISADWVHKSTEPQISMGGQEYAFHWWIKNFSVNNTLFKTFYALGHGEQAIILVPEHKLVLVMTAGNYFQTEHRPFEIVKDYILPSIQVGLTLQQDTDFEKFVGEYEINANEKITIERNENFLIAKDPSGATFHLIPKSSSHFVIENTSREVYFINDEQGIIVAAEIFTDGNSVDKFKKK